MEEKAGLLANTGNFLPDGREYDAHSSLEFRDPM